MTDCGNKIVSPVEFYGMKYTPELNDLYEEMKRAGPPPLRLQTVKVPLSRQKNKTKRHVRLPYDKVNYP